jgi:hypothetical protein
MEARIAALLAAASMAAAPSTHAADSAVAYLGDSPPLRTLAGRALAPVLEPPARGSLAIAPHLTGWMQAGMAHAEPALAPPGRARQVGTGGARVNVDSIAPGNVAASNVTGAVGRDAYMQMANGWLALYRKQDGALTTGPVRQAALFDGPCGAGSAGAAAILYDQLAARWVLLHQAWAAGNAATGPYYQCMAVSVNGDAGGRYHRYALRVTSPAGRGTYVDSPVLALWPDAYYLTFNQFDAPGGAWRGGAVCAMERLALLQGRAAIARCRDTGAGHGALTPVSWEGDAGSAAACHCAPDPMLLLALDVNVKGRGAHLLLWRYDLARRELRGPTALAVPPFTIACAGTQDLACIGQPQGAMALASFSDRLAPRAVYRQDRDGRRMVAGHTVQTSDGAVGLRWYEFGMQAGSVVLRQHGLHAGADAARFMGSIGMDKAGNLALGYSVAGADTPQGVRYSGREPGDPAGQLRGEEFIVNGAGVHVASSGAWRHNGMLSLDPDDGCTFWYSQQYVPHSGPNALRTRLASFRFRRCR